VTTIKLNSQLQFQDPAFQSNTKTIIIVTYMSLNYVLQVIYIPKININMPSPEDETVISHPN